MKKYLHALISALMPEEFFPRDLLIQQGTWFALFTGTGLILVMVLMLVEKVFIYFTGRLNAGKMVFISGYHHKNLKISTGWFTKQKRKTIEKRDSPKKWGIPFMFYLITIL